MFIPTSMYTYSFTIIFYLTICNIQYVGKTGVRVRHIVEMKAKLLVLFVLVHLTYGE